VIEVRAERSKGVFNVERGTWDTVLVQVVCGKLPLVAVHLMNVDQW
jgi:hypothetical protein